MKKITLHHPRQKLSTKLLSKIIKGPITEEHLDEFQRSYDEYRKNLKEAKAQMLKQIEKEEALVERRFLEKQAELKAGVGYLGINRPQTWLVLNAGECRLVGWKVVEVPITYSVTRQPPPATDPDSARMVCAKCSVYTKKFCELKCNHHFCEGCLKSYIQDQIEASCQVIICPMKCRTVLEETVIESYFGANYRELLDGSQLSQEENKAPRKKPIARDGPEPALQRPGNSQPSFDHRQPSSGLSYKAVLPQNVEDDAPLENDMLSTSHTEICQCSQGLSNDCAGCRLALTKSSSPPEQKLALLRSGPQLREPWRYTCTCQHITVQEELYCGHFICLPCFKIFVLSKIKDNDYSTQVFTCQVPSCGALITEKKLYWIFGSKEQYSASCEGNLLNVDAQPRLANSFTKPCPKCLYPIETSHANTEHKARCMSIPCEGKTEVCLTCGSVIEGSAELHNCIDEE